MAEAKDAVVLDRFELIERISTGGMGEVYLARVRGPYQFEKLFTLKLMKKEFADDAQDLQRFAREARIAAQLSHQNLVQVYDFGSVRGRYFIAMEYIDGLNLTRFMNGLLSAKLLLPFHLCAFIVAEVARALSHMHEMIGSDGKKLNLVHRDISPENILLSKEGQVKLSDFGLVKYEGAEKLTRNGKVRGKLSYMAPERAVGEEASPSSDQFSLGMVLHELITGRRYFTPNMERLEVQQGLLQDGIRPPSDTVKDLPEELNKIVACATSQVPADRFASLAEMEQALRRFVLHEAKRLNLETPSGELVAQLMEAVKLKVPSREKAAPEICRPLELFTDQRAVSTIWKDQAQATFVSKQPLFRFLRNLAHRLSLF